MTEEQMTLIKTLIKKHGISATDGEWTLVFLGASYGLTEKQIDSYLIADTSDLLAKHEKMLCISKNGESGGETADAPRRVFGSQSVKTGL